MADPGPSQSKRVPKPDENVSTSTVTVVETDEKFVNSFVMLKNFHTKPLKLIRASVDVFNVKSKSIQHIENVNINNSPLSGIRILDLTRIVAGPYCSMILGDLGAEVIKIERPGIGDEARKWGPPFRNKNKSLMCYFVSVNRNKKSVCVDIKSPEGRNIIYQLAKKCDVFIENYVPGKLDKLKLGYGDIKKIVPDIIYCSITGYGPVGPYSNKPSFDVIAASMGGLLHITGPEDGEPVKAGVALTDLSTGLYAHGAILAALYRRQKTGKGQKIDCDLLSTQVASLINIASNYLNAGQEAKRWGTAHESIVPYQAFPTKDGYITIGATSDAQFKDLCGRLGRMDLMEDDKFKTNHLRVENRAELIKILRSIMKHKTNKEWAKVFEGSLCAFAPINNIEQIFSDPHIKHIEIVKSFTHPDKSVGEVKVVGPPVIYSEGGNFARSAPPTLGQHTDEVLKNVINMSESELESLREKKIIQ